MSAQRLGSGMKSVGEVMAIGRNFEEAIQKAVRMLSIGQDGLVATKTPHFENLQDELAMPGPNRMFALPLAMKKGLSIDEIHHLTHIDRWFLYCIKHLVDIEHAIEAHGKDPLSKEIMMKAKRAGFSDVQIGRILKSDEHSVSRLRKRWASALVLNKLIPSPRNTRL